jgi:hypothetical protein
VPLPTSLVVKNGSKMRASFVAGMPWPSSIERHGDVRPTGHHRAVAPKRLAQVYDPRLDPDLAALGHGVARVHDEVHDHLFELPSVDADRQERRVMVERQLDLLPHQAVQQVHQVGHRVAQIDDLELQFLLTRERQKLAHQRRRAVGVLGDLHQIAEIRIALVMAQQQQVAMAR